MLGYLAARACQARIFGPCRRFLYGDLYRYIDLLTTVTPGRFAAVYISKGLSPFHPDLLL